MGLCKVNINLATNYPECETSFCMVFEISNWGWTIYSFVVDETINFAGDEAGFRNLCGYLGLINPAFLAVMTGCSGYSFGNMVNITCDSNGFHHYFSVSSQVSEKQIVMFWQDDHISAFEFNGLNPSFICELFGIKHVGLTDVDEMFEAMNLGE